jgi:prepilin-type processing-associated H-X9-DG protein
MAKRRVPGIVVVLLSVLCVLVLGVVLVLSLSRARSGARGASCLSNAKQIVLALEAYAEDFAGTYPWHRTTENASEASRDLGLLWPDYNSGFKSFFCPDSRDRPYVLNKQPLEPFAYTDSSEAISYAYSVDARDPAVPRPWTVHAPSTVRLIADKKAGVALTKRSAHKLKGRNVAYHDGHVKWKAGPDALDPDQDDDAVGKPGAPDYRDWWSDPPYYGE